MERRVDRLLRLCEVMEILVISRSGCYRLMASGALPVVKIGRNIRFSAIVVQRLMEKGTAAHV